MASESDILAKTVKKNISLIQRVLKNPNDVDKENLEELHGFLDYWVRSAKVSLESLQNDSIKEKKKTPEESIRQLYCLIHSEENLSISSEQFETVLQSVEGDKSNWDEASIVNEFDKIKQTIRTKSAVKLFARYMQAAVISHVRDKFSIEDAAALNSKSISQTYSEIKFYKLIKDYPTLIFLDLGFDKIKKGATKIRDIIELNDHYMKTFKTKVRINSATVVEIDVVY